MDPNIEPLANAYHTARQEWLRASKASVDALRGEQIALAALTEDSSVEHSFAHAVAVRAKRNASDTQDACLAAMNAALEFLVAVL